MYSPVRLLAAAALATALTTALASPAAHATAYTFTETFDNGAFNPGGASTTVTVTGSFEGTAMGNLISGLSNFTLFFNGLAEDPATLTAKSYNGGTAYDDNATLSFNGRSNNFLLSNSSDPATTFPTVALASLTALGNGNEDSGYNDTVYGFNNSPTENRLFITEAVAVPEPASIALLAMAAVGALATRRRRA